MIILLVFTILYNIALNSALAPLLSFLPKSLDAEERALLAEDRDATNGNEKYALHGETNGHSAADDLGPAPHKKPNMFTKWLRPDIYTDYQTLRRLVPKDLVVQYPASAEDEAYFNPSVTDTTPLLWIPRDPLGISRHEVADTSEVIPITDEGAYLDEKNKVVWDAQDGKPPIYEDPVHY